MAPRVPRNPSPPTTEDPIEERLKRRKQQKQTGTTTTVPRTPSTTFPSSTVPTTPTTRTSKDSEKLSIEVQRTLKRQADRARRLGIPTEEVEEIVSGRKPEGGGGILGAVGKVLSFDIIPGEREFRPLETAVVKPLIALDTGRRAIISGVKETTDLARQLTGRVTRYEASDYKPINPKTGERYKTGDKIPEEERSTFSWRDFVSQTTDPSFGFGDVAQTGNKWLDRTTGFVGDVIFDPWTYVAGPGGIAKTAATRGVLAGGKEGAKITARATAAQSAREAAALAAKEAADLAADATASRAAREAANKAASDAAAAAARATSRESAVAPRRVYGANAREALANSVDQIRREAVEEASKIGGNAAERAAAQRIVDTVTDDVIADIATRGYSAIRGQVAESLGLRGGLRFGIGTTKYYIPGTRYITDAFGTAAAATRIGATGRAAAIPKLGTLLGKGFVGTNFGMKVLNNITPRGEGGLLGSETVMSLRTGLRSGSLKGKEAADAVRLLAEDNAYRAVLQTERKAVQSTLQPLLANKTWKPYHKTVHQLLEAPEGTLTMDASTIASVIGREVDDAEIAFARAIKEADDALYSRVNEYTEMVSALGPAGAVTGRPRINNWFPHTVTEKTSKWLTSSNPAAKRVRQELGVDEALLRGTFVPNRLLVGDTFFGYTLTRDDIAGGVARLNEIARERGGLNFDFFDTNAAAALTKYGDKHARDLAFINSVDNMAAANEFMRYRDFESGMVTPAAYDSLERSIDALETSIGRLDPIDLQRWSVENIEQLRAGVERLRTFIQQRLDDGADIPASQFILDEIDDLNEFVADINAVAGSLPSGTPALLIDQAEKYAESLYDEVAGLTNIFRMTPAARWKSVRLENIAGFAALDNALVPDVAVRNDIAEIFTNISRLDDPKFAAAVDRALKDYTNFLKSYATLSPGFHLRNAIGNVFMFTAAGAQPTNLIEGLSVSRKWNKYLQEVGAEGLAARGVTPQELIDNFVETLPLKEQEAARYALDRASIAGFGQVGEALGEGQIRRTGLLGGEARTSASYALAAPLRGSRRAGRYIENHNRFMLTYDGVKQGLSPDEAVIRTKKYLVDYEDLSTLDRNIKQIIPFWMWTSRNLPLQIESIWLNPRPYQRYMSLKRNIEDEEGTADLPEWMRAAGAFALPGGLVARPDLPFAGAGRPQPLEALFAGQTGEILSSVTPLLRGPVELATNEQFFSGAPIVREGATEEEAALQRAGYATRQAITPLSTLGRILGIIPGEESEALRAFTGSRRAREEEAAGLQTETQSLLQYIGSPIFKTLPSQERNEIWRRYFQLKEVIDQLLEERREERLERRGR